MRKDLINLLPKAVALSLALTISTAVTTPCSAGAAASKNQSTMGVSVVVVMSYSANGVARRDYNGVALRGFDPVAYSTDGAAMMGRDGIQIVWRGVTYRFASEFNRKIFRTDPHSFLAQFDGHCAFAAAMGQKVEADPNAWAAYDGKIYLFSDERVKAIWQKNTETNIARAESNWPSIR